MTPEEMCNLQAETLRYLLEKNCLFDEEIGYLKKTVQELQEYIIFLETQITRYMPSPGRYFN